MRRWYTVKVKYTKTIQKNEEETTKTVNESFLLPAVSFTDAEARIHKEVGESAGGEFLVNSMSVIDVTEIFRNSDGGSWYLCKTVSEYEEEGKITRTKYTYMVEAASVKDASGKLDQRLSDAMFDYEITNIALSPVVDVFYEDLDVELSRTPAVESN